MKHKGLFRQEAIDNVKTKWLGHALLTSGFSVRLNVLITVFFISVILIVIIFCNYTRRVNVTGEVTTIPRAVNIFSPVKGFVSHIQMSVGDLVRKGDTLYQVDVSQTTRSGNVSENMLHSVQQQIKITEGIIFKLLKNKENTVSQLKEQLVQYESAYKESKTIVDNARKGMAEMKKTMDNYAEYKKRGLINSDQVTNQRYLYYQQQSAYQNLNTQQIQQGLQITILKGDIVSRETDFDNQIAEQQYQLSHLRRQLSEMDATGAILISAPIDGTIETLSVTQGQMVNSGDSLAQLVPAESQGYFMVLWLPDNSIPYVHKGDRINIRYDAFPYEKFGQFAGRVISVSGIPASPQELSSYNTGNQSQQHTRSEPLYKVLIDLSIDPRGASLALTSGLKAQATVFLEKRPIYQWMLSPFYDIYKSLTGPVHE